MKHVLPAVVACHLLLASSHAAPVPPLLNYQGRILVGSTVFDGVGHFGFSLVDATGTQSFWSNAPDANADGRPDATVALVVSRGLYSVLLGDTTLTNMAGLPVENFPTGDVFLRVWFDDGVHGLEWLSPDQRLASVGYALVAGTVPDQAITAAKLAPGAVSASALSGPLLPSQLPALDASRLASGVIDPARLPAGIAWKDPDLSDLGRTVGAVNTRMEELGRWISAVEARLGTIASTVGPPPGSVLASVEATDATLMTQGYAPFASLAAAGWTSHTRSDGPSPRFAHGAVWIDDRRQMWVWGGQNGQGSLSAAGALYQPGTDDWQAVSPFEAPEPRRGHSTVWDGVQGVYVWGGSTDSGYTSTGARYDLAASAWTAMSTNSAPSGRDGHVAVVVGANLVIWGGRDNTGRLDDLALYNFVTDTWSRPSLAGGPSPRTEATAVFTGAHVLIWGGRGISGPENTGARLAFQAGVGGPIPGSWSPITSVNAPSARTGHTAIWTGSRWLIWGGRDGSTVFGDGASYDPSADAWTPLPESGAPAPRSGHVALWTGSEMLIFGGDLGGTETPTGAAFDPRTGRWRPLSLIGDPLPRVGATAVWSGTEMIVFGGQSGGQPVAALQRLSPQPAWHLYRKLQP